MSRDSVGQSNRRKRRCQSSSFPIGVLTRRRCRAHHKELVERYRKKSVYIDVDSVQVSADYRVHIAPALERTLVMVTVIGKEWAGPRAEGKARISRCRRPGAGGGRNRLCRSPPRHTGAHEQRGNAAGSGSAGKSRTAPLPQRCHVAVGGGVSLRHQAAASRRRPIEHEFSTMFASLYFVLPFALILRSHPSSCSKSTPSRFLPLVVAAIAAAFGLRPLLSHTISYRCDTVTGAALDLSTIGMMAAVTALDELDRAVHLLEFLRQARGGRRK